MRIGTYSTGHFERVTGRERIPKFNPVTREHFWVIAGSWKCEPEKIMNGKEAILDHENLIKIAGPGCFYCIEMYSPEIATQKCTGKP